jgi:hypothetical protein
LIKISLPGSFFAFFLAAVVFERPVTRSNISNTPFAAVVIPAPMVRNPDNIFTAFILPVVIFTAGWAGKIRLAIFRGLAALPNGIAGNMEIVAGEIHFRANLYAVK